MKVLRMTIKKRWFDMIAAGIKKEEYRDVKQYWIDRLTWHEYHKKGQLELMEFFRSKEAFRKDFDAVEFKNGYSPKSSTVTVQLKGIRWGFPKTYEWIDEEEKSKPTKFYFCLELGEIIASTNVNNNTK